MTTRRTGTARWSATLFALATAIAGACGRGPDFGREMQALCASTDERAAAQAPARTPEMRNVMRALAAAPPGERARLLERAAREARLSSCPLAERMGAR